MGDIKGEMKFLLDKWHGNKPKEGDIKYSEYQSDREKYFSLKAELQIQQAEAIFGTRSEPLTIGDRDVIKQVGDAALVWMIEPGKKVEVLVKRK